MKKQTEPSLRCGWTKIQAVTVNRRIPGGECRVRDYRGIYHCSCERAADWIVDGRLWCDSHVPVRGVRFALAGTEVR